MPIYSYLCPECQHAQDHLMKISDQSPSCPKCTSEKYAKQVTAAAFALKGNGFYATDFKSSQAATNTPNSKPCGGSCACHPS